MTAAAGVSRSDAIGWVYFLQSGDRPFVKIGWAIDPTSRIASLQCGSPEELRLLGRVQATMAEEMEWHRRFCHLHFRAEWFHLSEELRHAIADQRAFMDALRSLRPPGARAARTGDYKSRLTPTAVIAIRADRRSVRAIAADHRVSKTCVQDIRMRRTWRHVL